MLYGIKNCELVCQVKLCKRTSSENDTIQTICQCFMKLVGKWENEFCNLTLS